MAQGRGAAGLRATAALCATLAAGCGTLGVSARRTTVPAGPAASRRPAVEIDISSAEALLLRPESVLADVHGFWERDLAYWLVAKHAEEAGFAVPPAGWEAAIGRFASVPASDREAQPRYSLARQLAGAERRFNDAAVPHILSFFAPDGVDLSTTVYVTVATWQNAFQKDHRIVVNISHPEWRGDADVVLNTLVHELFHVGFYRAEPLMTEVQLDDSERYDVFLNLLNEGMATWVGYTARGILPSGVADYAMLDDSGAVRNAIRNLNSLLASEGATPSDEFRRRVWEVGVQQRALYVAGAHMARAVERAAGRAALVRAFRSGPRSFVAEYNRLVTEDARVIEFPAPRALSPYQEMRRSALASDYRAMRRAVDAIRAHHAAGGEPVGHALHTTGHLLLSRQEAALAIEVFSLYRDLFPRHPNPLEGLARGHLMRGDRVRAEEACRQLLSISPSNIFAVETVASLGATQPRR